MKTKSLVATMIGCAILLGCSANLDPFATPPVGMKIHVKPMLINQMPSYSTAQDLGPATTMIRLNFAQATKEISSIQLTPAKGLVETVAWNEIIKATKTKSCQDQHKSALDGLTDFGDLILVCDPSIADRIKDAIFVSFQFKDGSQTEFTSWGTSMSQRLDGKPLAIHVFSF